MKTSRLFLYMAVLVGCVHLSSSLQNNARFLESTHRKALPKLPSKSGNDIDSTSVADSANDVYAENINDATTGTDSVSTGDDQVLDPIRTNKTGIVGIVGAAVLVAAVVASIAARTTPTSTPSHPLKGSLDRRIKIFGKMAFHFKREQPMRATDYVPAPDSPSPLSPAIIV